MPLRSSRRQASPKIHLRAQGGSISEPCACVSALLGSCFLRIDASKGVLLLLFRGSEGGGLQVFHHVVAEKSCGGLLRELFRALSRRSMRDFLKTHSAQQPSHGVANDKSWLAMVGAREKPRRPHSEYSSRPETHAQSGTRARPAMRITTMAKNSKKPIPMSVYLPRARGERTQGYTPPLDSLIAHTNSQMSFAKQPLLVKHGQQHVPRLPQNWVVVMCRSYSLVVLISTSTFIY